MAENIPTYPDLAVKVALVTGWSGGIGAAEQDPEARQSNRKERSP